MKLTFCPDCGRVLSLRFAVHDALRCLWRPALNPKAPKK
jgi:hypothetical protein